MPTATAHKHTSKAETDDRQMISIVGTPEGHKTLNQLRSESGMSKRLIVLLGLQAFKNLKPAQRAALASQFPLA